MWNAAYLWQVGDPTPSLADGLRTFWFDVTKSDWRSTMVLGVHETALKRRVGLYAFDLRQQIGVAGIALALVGLVSLWRRLSLLLILVLAYGVAFVFAYTYNVGDVHVFFLPSHQIAILIAALGASAVWQMPSRLPATARAWVATVVTVAAPGPAGLATLGHLAGGRSARRHPADRLARAPHQRGQTTETLLLADVNWQLDNGLDYFTRHVRPDLNVARVTDRVLSLPLLVRDNLAAGREVLMTPESRRIDRGRLRRSVPVCGGPSRGRAASGRRGLARCRPIPCTCSPCWRRTPTCLLTRRSSPTSRLELTGGSATLAKGPSYQVLAGRLGMPPIPGSPQKGSPSGPPWTWPASPSTSGWSRGCQPTRCDAPGSATSWPTAGTR